MNKPFLATVSALVIFLSPLPASAAMGSDSDSRNIEINKVNKDGVGESIGTIQVKEYESGGVLFTPKLEGLEPGLHGFHMHQNATCESAKKDGKVVPAAAAGGHYNPNDGGHNGPYEKGHMGDLPALYVDEDGNATTPVLAPRLDYSDISDRSLMIHAGGDNYSDNPETLGGGGARVACGVISKQ